MRAHLPYCVRPVYDCKRVSRRQLFGIYCDNVLLLICTRFPTWVTKR
jgi:hypothetical protein